MALIMMVSAKGEAAVVSAATVSCIRKRYILMLIVTYSVAAAVGLEQVFGLAAEPTPGFPYFICGFGFMLSSQFFIRIIRKSPLSPLCQRGVYFLPLAKGGQEGFYKNNVVIMSPLIITFHTAPSLHLL